MCSSQGHEKHRTYIMNDNGQEMTIAVSEYLLHVKNIFIALPVHHICANSKAFYPQANY